MKLLIIPSCNLPMPPVLGGAVQTLINDFLEWNEISKQFDITVASIYNPAAEMRAQEYIFTKFKFYKNENKTIRAIMEKIVRVVGHYEIGDSFINNVCNDLQKDSYDIILVENVKNYGAIIKRYFSCPVLLHLHNEYFKQNKPNMKRMIASYNSIIAVSSYIKNTVLNCSEMAKVSVLLNGIDKSEFDPSKKNKMLLRQKYGFSGIDTIFISAARICEDKGTLETVKAFNLLSNTSNARAKLIILGSKDYGKTIRDEYFEKVLAEANKNIDNIVFTGYVKHEEISNYYALSDIGVLTSNFDDPCPLTILEYLAMHLPVIATKSGGIPELVDSECAILVDRDNMEIQNIKNSMELLIENADLRTRMGIHGREIVKSKYMYCEQLSKLMKSSL